MLETWLVKWMTVAMLMALTEYRRKRNFRRTPEPRGARVARHKKLTFVIQKHDASHLHYDFRLELDGVLKSWAVPKGPSLDPANKRLAMQVEDHPFEYGKFEGVIPKGEYGGGTVMLWDHGTWEPLEDPQRGLRRGRLKFVLHGKKLHGGWMLVRRGGRSGEPGERHWFLFKEHDEFADSKTDITVEEPLSVTTGRDLNEIATRADRVWGPKGELTAKQRHARREKTTTTKVRAKATKRATTTHKIARKASVKVTNRKRLQEELRRLAPKRARLPAAPLVELATLATEAPEGDQWFHEIKYDGYRMLCRVDGQDAALISRNGKNWTRKFPELVDAATQLGLKNGVLDGEVVALDLEGRSSFQSLQKVFQNGSTAQLIYYAFDLLFVDGYDVTADVLEDRKKLLRYVVPESTTGSIRYSDHIVGHGPECHAEACRLGLEGIISKRRDRPYRHGRGMDWLKIKCAQTEEFVIGGFTRPAGTRNHFGALLLGYHDPDGPLIYCGRVGTGFDEQTLRSMHAQLVQLSQRRSPFVNLSGSTGQARGVSWVAPKLVAQVRFANWTEEGVLRQPAFLGLRQDKPAAEVIREKALPLPALPTVSSNGYHKPRRSPMPKRSVSHARPRRSTAAEPAKIAGVNLSHPDKVLYPGDDITKQELAEYYEAVARWMLPHVAGRLLALVRCPDGHEKGCFFQKHPAVGTADVFERTRVREKSKTGHYLSINDTEGLISLVQMGVLEIHVWGSQAHEFEKPDRLVFDLDPDVGLDWSRVVAAAREVRSVLDELGLHSFVKTTGGKGLHVVVPIQRRHSWPQVKEFCRAVADFMVRTAPDRYIATMSKAARKGKVFVDYLRNDRGATSIAAYSTRARPGATVSVPIEWDELKGRVRSDSFTIRNVPDRLRRLRRDPWAKMAKTRQSITSDMLSRLNRVTKPR